MATYAIDEEFLARIERLQTILKNNIAGLFGGSHKSKSFGSSCEFTDYRYYQAGDDITKIDWNAYARFDELFLKLYMDERQLHTRIYIDTSRSMEADGKKAEAALKIAATFAYLSVCELDRVSIYAMSGSTVTEVVSNIVGRERFLNEITKLNDIEFGGECFITDGIMPSKVGYGDGLSVIVSDFLTDADYETAIDYLAEKKRDLLCVQVLSSEEVHPQVRGKNHFFDSENPGDYYRKNITNDIIRAYKEAVKYVQDRIRTYCNARGAEYILYQEDKPIDEFFFEQLSALGVIK